METTNKLDGKIYEMTFLRTAKSYPSMTHVLAHSEDEAIERLAARTQTYKVLEINGKYVCQLVNSGK